MNKIRAVIKTTVNVTILYTFIFASMSLVLANETGDISHIKYTVPKNVLKITPKKMVDTEVAIQRARKFFRHKNGDKWLWAIWGVESGFAPPDEFVIGDDGQSLGHFQIQVDTVRTIEDFYDLDLNMSDYEIRYKLLTDFMFGAEMCGRYLGYIEKKFKYTWKNVITGYNSGPAKRAIKRQGKKGYPYYNKVYRKYKKMK